MRPSITFFPLYTVSFKVYDYDRDGLIGIGDLTEMVVSTLNEQNLIVTAEEVDQIVEATFKEAACSDPGKISFEE